ncbi:MAG: sugar transferase [Spirochaetales bacterium]|nr:sugar transferase [Spirochaetales bacterium]
MNKDKERCSIVVYKIVKGIVDLLCSLIGIVILFPLFLIISILIKASSKGPVFFVQERIGINGRKFKLYKFRTMVNNAEDLIASFTPEQKKEWKENFKLVDDPRITKIGKFLRKTSLDELPQLINIFKGDMSFVGPRPIIDEELLWYGDQKEKLLTLKPGLTGWWAVNGRSNVPYPERCDLELYYVDHFSLYLDIVIIFRTIGAIIKKDGAR